MVKTSVDAEANSNVQYIRWHFSDVWLHDFEKPKRTQTRRSATTCYRPWRSRCATGSSGSCSANGPGGLPHLRELPLFCTCVRAGAKLRPNLETTSGEEIPCPDLRLRSGRNIPFSVDFPILVIVRASIRLHMQCTQILL